MKEGQQSHEVESAQLDRVAERARSIVSSIETDGGPIEIWAPDRKAYCAGDDIMAAGYGFVEVSGIPVLDIVYYRFHFNKLVNHKEDTLPLDEEIIIWFRNGLIERVEYEADYSSLIDSRDGFTMYQANEVIGIIENVSAARRKFVNAGRTN